MKLSEAILLGDTLKNPDSGRWLGRDGNRFCGCALGGAALAAGFGEQHVAAISNLLGGYIPFEKRLQTAWPWINAVQRMHIGQMYIQVASGKMTIEQVADYVRTIEPTEDTDPGDEQAELTEQLRLEEEDAAEEGAAIEASGYPDPAENVRFA